MRSIPLVHASRRRRYQRRGFNLAEMLIALAVSGALLTATMAALDASFKAYQTTTEVASTHTISRLTMHRIQTLIRTGWDFEPVPADPQDSIVQSDWIQFRVQNGTDEGAQMGLVWVEADEALYFIDGDIDTGARYLLLEGVLAQDDEGGNPILPFTLEFQSGINLYRATVDLTIVPDDNQSLELEGHQTEVLRLIASSMPRSAAFE